MINADKLGNGRYRTGTRRDSEFAAEEAKLLDELLAAADLTSPTTPGARSGDETSDARAPYVETTWEAPDLAAEPPDQQAAAVWPSAYSDTESEAPAIPETTTVDYEPGKAHQPRQAWTLGDTALGDEDEPAGELGGSVDLSSAASPEVLHGDGTGGTEQPHLEMTWQPAAPEPPEQQAVAVWPSAYVETASEASTVVETTTVDEDEPARVDEPRQAWNLDTEPAAEQPELVNELAGAAGAGAPDAPEGATRAGAPQLEPTWQSASSELPGEPAVIVWPSAYAATTSAVPTDADTATTDDAGPGRTDDPRQAWSPQTWSLSDTDLAGAKARPLDEVPPFSGLSLPTTPELVAGDQASDPDAAQIPGTSQAVVETSEQPDEQAIAMWPFAYGAATPAAPAAPDTVTTDVGEPRLKEEPHQAWNLDETELATEAAKPTEELAAEADLGALTTAEVLSGGQANDAGTPQFPESRQEAAPWPPEQPDGRASTVVQSVDSAETPATPTVSETAATTSADKPGELDARYRPWMFPVVKLVADQTKAPEEPPASADLTTPADVPSGDQASDAETPQLLDTGEPEQPEVPAVTESPSGDSASAPWGPTVADTTTISVDRAHELDARYRPWTLPPAKFAGDEVKSADEPPASADLLATTQVALRSTEQPTEAVTARGELTRQTTASVAREPASPTVPEATTIVADEPDDLDARYRAWVLRAAEEAKPFDGLPTSDDLSSRTAAEAPSAEQPSGVETFEVEVTQQASTPAPQQPEEQAAKVPPPGDIAPKPGPTVPDATTIGTTNRPARFDARYRAWNFRDIADEPQPVDEVPSSGDSRSTTAEAPSAERPSGVETFEVEVTQQAPSRALQQPEDHAASADSQSTHAGSTVPETTTVREAHKPGKLDVRYRPWTLGAAELAAEEAQPSEAAPETRSAGQMSGAETPHVQVSWQAPAFRQSGEPGATVSPSGHSSPTSAASTFTSAAQSVGETKQSRRRLRISPARLGVLALVFLLTTLGTGFVALNQSSSARQWRQYDHSAAAFDLSLSTRNGVLTRDLASARAEVTILKSQTSALTGQVKSLQNQLSSAASTKQKALVRTPLFSQITTEAGAVSNELSICEGNMGSLQTEIENDLANPNHKDPLLQSNTHTANLVCAAAEQDGQRLQTTLRMAG
ncbi:MAG: hypothetical protein ABSA65_08980 [Acidimicrobiales bacterium]|jgi:hypothetical protein